MPLHVALTNLLCGMIARTRSSTAGEETVIFQLLESFGVCQSKLKNLVYPLFTLRKSNPIEAALYVRRHAQSDLHHDLLTGLHQLALADGSMTTDEQNYVNFVGRMLGFEPEQLLEIENQAIQKFPPPVRTQIPMKILSLSQLSTQRKRGGK